MTLLSGTLAQYSERTVDLLLVDGVSAARTVKLDQVLVQPGQSGALITGIEKLAQRFLLELLTELGSLQYAPTRGTLFMLKLRAGGIQTSQDLFMIFNEAENTLSRSLRLEDDTDVDALDECYHSATLLTATLSGDQAVLSLQINSMAGTERTVLYPLRVSLLGG